MRKIKVPTHETIRKEQGLCEGSSLSVSMTKSGTKECPHCGRRYRITQAGKLTRHKAAAPHWTTPAKCHRKHSRARRCAWCGLVKGRAA